MHRLCAAPAPTYSTARRSLWRNVRHRCHRLPAKSPVRRFRSWCRSVTTRDNPASAVFRPGAGRRFILAYHVPDHHQHRAGQIGLRKAAGQFSDGCRDDGLVRPGGARDGKRRRARVETFSRCFLDQGCERAHRHVDRRRGRRIGKALPVEISRQLSIVSMTGDVLQAARMLAVGEWNAKFCGSTLGCGNAGHHVVRRCWRPHRRRFLRQHGRR